MHIYIYCIYIHIYTKLTLSHCRAKACGVPLIHCTHHFQIEQKMPSVYCFFRVPKTNSTCVCTACRCVCVCSGSVFTVVCSLAWAYWPSVTSWLSIKLSLSSLFQPLSNTVPYCLVRAEASSLSSFTAHRTSLAKGALSSAAYPESMKTSSCQNTHALISSLYYTHAPQSDIPKNVPIMLVINTQSPVHMHHSCAPAPLALSHTRRSWPHQGLATAWCSPEKKVWTK
jgi:hypothetical protein